MQVSVGGQQFGAYSEAAGQTSRLNAEEFNADQAGQVTLSAEVEVLDGGHKSKV